MCVVADMPPVEIVQHTIALYNYPNQSQENSIQPWMNVDRHISHH